VIYGIPSPTFLTRKVLTVSKKNTPERERVRETGAPT
jgi:hypothetical protein